MIEIIGTELNQWDIGRSVKVTDASHVHFANQGDSRAVIMELTNSQALIPNYLLQTGKQLCVYAVANGVTIDRKTFSVKKREKPEDYIYTETEMLTWEALDRRITALERGGGGGEGGFSPIVTVKPIAGGHRVTIIDAVGEQTFDIMDGKDGASGSNGKDGYTPVRGKDYWTEQDKNEIKSYVDEAILGGEW